MNIIIIYKILLTLLWTSSGLIIAVCLENMLAGNEQRSSRRKRIGYWTAIAVAMGAGHAFLTHSVALFINSIFIIIASFFMTVRHYKGRFSVKLTAIALLLLAPNLADILACAVYYFVKGESPAAEFDKISTLFVIISLSVQLIGSALQGIICTLWCRVKKKRQPLSYLAFFSGFVILSVCILLSRLLSVSNSFSASQSGIYMTVTCCLFLTSCGAIFVLLNQMEKNEISKELEKIRQISSLEHVHYEAVEARREEMAEIRHDYNNILTSVLYLLNNGSTDEAEEMLSELSNRISATHEYRFCHIPIINAVLAEKQEQCVKENISFHADILLPEALPIDNLDLCSAFSNLIDNAIRACKKEAEPGKAEIFLSCKVNKGYLIIKCVNPSQRAPSDKPDNTGYGHKILKNIALRYNGNFLAEYADKKYTAHLSLLMNV